MRQLTKSQKKLLDITMSNNPAVEDWETLPLDVIKKLEAINDTEILWQEANRYISDRRMQEIFIY